MPTENKAPESLPTLAIGAEPKTYPDRLCHIDYTSHPHRCGCLSGDDEAHRRFDEYQSDAKLATAESEVTRLTAERDALQQRMNAADQQIDELEQDKARLDALDSNCWDVRFNSSPNGDAGDSSINIEVIGHWMDKPFERVIGENYSENLRAAIDQAMTAPAYPPARPEYPEPESSKDDAWHMNPCKKGHRDVGAAGGVAHCYTCDEKIEAATTQEAFERRNATHPAAQA
jgi:outer membrane murein-binding lipoprotein Lpp